MRTNAKKLLSLLLIICLSTSLGLYADSCKTNASDTASTQTSDTSTSTAANQKSSLKLTFSKKSGVYKNKFSLTLSCSGSTKIYYTTDGSNPKTSSTRKLYSKSISVADRSKAKNYVSAVDPFLFDAANVRVNSKGNGFVGTSSKPSSKAVDKCTVIRAVAVDSQGLYTDVATNTYFVGSMAKHITGIQKSCESSGNDLAVVSLSIDYKDLFDSKTGIYVKGDIYKKALKEYLTSGKNLTMDTSRKLDANYSQKGKEWERAIHMDFFESDGTTTSCALQQDCGVRIQGNYSRSDLQKGLRLFARDEYGKKNFNYAFFGSDLKDDSGKSITKFKSLTLRNGGNCAFTTKYSDTYWQSLIKDLDCDTQTSRPCVVFIDGEYWGLYVLQEDYSQDYFADAHGVNKDDVVLYKGDAEEYSLGYKLDLGDLPDGTTDETYYFKDLLDFFSSHKDLSSDADYEAFSKLVDVNSARDYFAVQVWINNKWDWPGKNWSMWKTAKVDSTNPYADGKWRFCFYDVEFGGVSGSSDAYTNTIQADNYKPNGLLDMSTTNPAVLTYAYLMTNAKFRSEFAASLKALSSKNFKYKTALARLDEFKNTYSPLYSQFFNRYPGTGNSNNSINGNYASYQCIKDFLKLRADNIQPMIDYVNGYFGS